MKKDKLHIHWYPGHIAKAERQLKEQLTLVDVVIEVRDARIPISSSYSNIKKLLGDKPRLLLLNKADLTDTNELKLWVKYLEDTTQCPIFLTDTKNGNNFSKVIDCAIKLSEPAIKALTDKGMLRRATRAMVVGMPNVGKSSIINKLTKSSKTKTGAKAGVTRQQQWVRINPKLDLLDTPGIIPTRQDDQNQATKLAFVSSVSENAYTPELVAKDFLELISQNDKYYNFVRNKYNLESTDILSVENIAIRRNWLIKGNNPDIQRAANNILKDFREGRLGKFILDNLPE